MPINLCQDDAFFAATLILLVAILGAFWAITVKYLQQEGVATVQLFFISQFNTFLYTAVVHIGSSMSKSNVNSSMIQHEFEDDDHNDHDMSDRLPLLGIEDEQLQASMIDMDSSRSTTPQLQPVLVPGASCSNPYSRTDLKREDQPVKELEPVHNDDNNNFCDHFLSVFPGRDDYETWQILVSRGVLNALNTQCCLIGFMFLDGGDAMLLRTTISSLLMLGSGILYFGELFTKWIALSLILAGVGLTLTIQPTFIFDSSVDNQISIIGLIFITLSAFFRASDRLLLKYSGNLDVHWMAMLLGSYAACTLFGLMEIIGLIFYYYIKCDFNSNCVPWNDKIWYEWTSTDTTKDIKISMFLILLGVIVFFLTMCQVISFQIGDIGKLGILVTCEVALVYLLEAWLLDETDNYLTYVGVVFVTLYSIIIFCEQTKQAKERLNNDIRNHVQQSQESQQVQQVQESISISQQKLQEDQQESIPPSPVEKCV